MNSNALKIENVRKIAVLRANALGDFIVTTPALNALRYTYPDSEIVLLGKQWHKDFLVKGRSVTDRVMIVPDIKGITAETNENEDEIKRFFEAMQRENFDIVINMQGGGKYSNTFIKQLGAKLTVGSANEQSPKPDRYFPYYYYQSEAIRFCEIVRLTGAISHEYELQINVLEEDETEIDSLILDLNAKPFVVLQPCAVDIRRMWPLENYPALADALKERNVEVVFTGSQEDKTAVDEIIASMKFNALNTCGELSLGGLTALLSKALLVIGADTGPLHLARAVNTPTIGIYWAPNLINWGPVTRNIHRPVVSWNMACPFCGEIPNNPYPFEPKNNCDHKISFIRDITVEQVLHETDILLKEVLHLKPKLNKKQIVQESDTTRAKQN